MPCCGSFRICTQMLWVREFWRVVFVRGSVRSVSTQQVTRRKEVNGNFRAYPSKSAVRERNRSCHSRQTAAKRSFLVRLLCDRFESRTAKEEGKNAFEDCPKVRSNPVPFRVFLSRLPATIWKSVGCIRSRIGVSTSFF